MSCGDFFDFGQDREVFRNTVIDRGHTDLLELFDNIGGKIQFTGYPIGTLTRIGEDDHDYWVHVTYDDGKEILHTLLVSYKIIGDGK